MKYTFLVLSALGLVGCSAKAPQDASADPKAAPIAVQAITVAPAGWPSIYEATGTVKARTVAVLSSQVMGHVREVNVRAGDRVREGQVLVVLDARDLEAGYRQAEAARGEARGAIPEADNGIAAAQANLDLAKVTFSRMKDLFEKRSISNQEFDEAAAKLKVAQAGYQMALARRTQLDSKIAQADQAVRSAEILRGYTQIAAPFAGLITEKTVEPGSLAAPGAPLLTLEREGAFRLEASVEESKVAAVRLGQPVTVMLDALGRPIQGRVAEIAPAIDPGARAFIAKIDLPVAPELRSGLYGRAIFSFGTRPVLAVPAAAVTERGQLSSVFVAGAGRAKARFVTLGQKAQDRVEVLSGLDSGERVICPVTAGLSDGASVEVRP
jgi:multidrug efflux system membrane fusion protein